MAKEIERKFLVKNGHFEDPRVVKSKQLAFPCLITQGYFDTNGATVRVRISKSLIDSSVRAYLTLKGPSKGIVRDEFEYAIPVQDAEKLMLLTKYQITKVRGLINTAKGEKVCLWEVDYFPDFDRWVAEIELETEDQVVELPDFVKREVSDDSRYSNKNLAKDGWPK